MKARKLSPQFIEQVQQLNRNRWNALVRREEADAQRQQQAQRPKLRLIKGE